MTISAKSFAHGPGAVLALALAAVALPGHALADPDGHDPRGGGMRGGAPAAAAPRPSMGGEIPGPHNQPPAARPAPIAQPAQGGWNGNRPGGIPQTQQQPQGAWNGNRPGGIPQTQQQPQGGWNGNRPGGIPQTQQQPQGGWNGNRPGAPQAQRGNEGWRGAPGWNGDRRGGDFARGGDNRGWSHDWRRDNRYDWQGWRRDNRMTFHVGRYYPPYRGYAYRRLSVGLFLEPLFYGDTYRIYDPWTYHLPPVYGPYQWVRYYDDAVLIDIYTGAVTEVLYDFFW